MNANTIELWNFKSEKVRTIRTLTQSFSISKVMLPMRRVLNRTNRKRTLRGFLIACFRLIPIILSYGNGTFEYSVTIFNYKQFKLFLDIMI